MREEDGLRRLDVRHPGQDRVTLALRERHERALHPDDRRVVADRPACPEPQVRGNLVVPGTARVELARQRPDARSGAARVHVDVLETRVPGQRTQLHVDPERLEAADQRSDLRIVEQAGATEAADMGDRAGDIVERERAIDLDRSGEVGRPRVRLAAEPPAPEPHAASPTPAWVP